MTHTYTNGHKNEAAPASNGHDHSASTTNGYSNSNGIGNSNGPTKPKDHIASQNHTNGSTLNAKDDRNALFEPIAICGMACRLPGGITSPKELWDFLIERKDGRSRVPKTRYNIDGWYSPGKHPGTSNTEYGYFLDESVDLAGLDTSFFSMTRKEVEWLDPQQRIMLEVARESLEDACVVGWEGSDTGVYMGNFTQDWYDMMVRDGLRHSHYAVTTSHDFMISERISHEMDLRGPSLTIRTACSSALTSLSQACMAIAKGDCDGAIVGGTSIILAPDMTTRLSGQGVLSPDGSCKTFSADANGYARGEAIVSLYIKSLSSALRDGNPIRSVISGTAENFDGRTFPLTMPSATSQESLIRKAYQVAGITDYEKTALFECHGTGTYAGDPIETEAIAAVFGDKGIIIGAIKPNLGHSEGASGLTAILKATLALEHRMIPPNIKYLPLNPRIPFESAKLQIPKDLTPWPKDREERVSINSFGVGGANAHVIVESRSDFVKRQSPEVPKKAASVEPQLLLFSANTEKSLKCLEKKYQGFLESKSGTLDLADVAHTLANGRNHLIYRSFALATDSKFELTALPTSNSRVATPRSIVMVFTGQGAAWPQAGRALLLSNETFSHTITALDRHLQTLGNFAPEWSLRNELLKPTRTSRVGEAEFSQPLCTALQIGLVDTFKSFGILPSAVVGHSSGEIGAAYAAGALTAEEAITVAYQRGLCTKGRTERGGMLAVGLGWDQVQEYLVPGVVTACDNSPNSVTLSGDDDKLDGVASSIKENYPATLTTRLKVDKAYHSHHMLSLGQNYELSMIKSGVVGRSPAIPFFSSVKGRLLDTPKGDKLGPSYWRANLERPVLFKAAVSALINSDVTNNEVFVELGPHSALAGPLRQIMVAESSNAAYVSTLIRRQHSGENLLQAIGKLYNLHVDINLRSLVPGGSFIADLPRYPWDHSRKHWSESRLTKEWRGRKYKNHSLLGLRLPDCTELEPVWRNLLQADTVPWVLDHRIDDTIVFPLTGYVSMAAEAVRQISGLDDGVSFRGLAVNNALVLTEYEATEVITTLRPHRLTESLDSEWWEFTITSHNGHSWTKHCTGQARAETLGAKLLQLTEIEDLPRKVEAPVWYEAQRLKGLTYGPKFAIMEQIRSSTGQTNRASAIVRNNVWGDESEHHIHPVILDAYFQAMSVSVFVGVGRRYQRLLASSIDSMTIYRCRDEEFRISTSSKPTDKGFVGQGSLSVEGKTFMQISGAHVSIFEEEDETAIQEAPITAHSKWIPHIEFLKPSSLIKQSWDVGYFEPLLDELAQVGIGLARSIATSIAEPPSNLAQYHGWLLQHTESTTSQSDLHSRFDSLLKNLENTDVSHAADAIAAVYRNMDSLLRGDILAMEALGKHGRLDRFNDFLKDHDNYDYFRHVAYSKPNIRVLEVSAGLGNKTRNIIRSLTSEDGQALYSEYVVSDPLSTVVSTTKDRLKDLSKLEFAVLDLNEDLAAQNFEGRKFDLIIASNAFSTSQNVEKSLRNLKNLLSENGRLVLQESRRGISWAKFVLGLLPGWWGCAGDLDRVGDPFLGIEKWKDALGAAGFSQVVQEGQESSNLTNVFIAKSISVNHPANRITLLDAGNSCAPRLFYEELENRGYTIDRCSLGQKPKAGQNILCFLDEERPFLENLDSIKIAELKSLVNHLDHASLIWVTRPSSIVCADPSYAQIVGLMRTLRNETSKDLTVLEIEKVDSHEGAALLADFIDIFPSIRNGDGALGPDYEYAIHNGQTLVNRIFPFSLNEELTIQEASEEAVMTQGQPGRLDSLTWSTKPKDTLGDHDIEVEVYASGINFRDVLVAMQIIPGRHEPKFGYEAAGLVRRVGSRVTKLSAGDRAVVVGINTFSTLITGHEIYYEKLPNDISFIQGACIPTVFITAIYSLVELARLSSGQSVLIHSGAGGVGLAAIQVAQMMGATVYTTVGSKEKAQYLMETYGLPRDRIFNSRDASFVDDLLDATGGRGVDVALNSLAGELLHATWKCVAPWGAMVEIGKRDILGSARLDMSPFLANRRYCCLDVEQMRQEKPELSSKMLKFAMECFEQGKLKPIRVDRVFKAPAVLESFRYMQQGKHIGKIVVEIRDANGQVLVEDVKAEKKVSTRLDEEASYLLVGGLGGLGRAISVWLVEHGARNLAFLSRSAGTGRHDADFKRELESMGCTVQFFRGDVTDPKSVETVLGSVLAPLKGVFQMSMVLRDQMFQTMSADDWHAVIEPKIQGTWSIHQATSARGIVLDFFVLFSSLSGILGQVGQANYASANTYLDAFVRYRNSKNLACTAIDLGAMEGIGYLSENQDLLKKMQGTGWRAVTETNLLDALPLAMMSTLTRKQQKIIRSNSVIRDSSFLLGIAPTVPLCSPESSSRLRRDVRMAVYHNIGAGGSNSGRKSGSATDGLRAFLVRLSKDASLLGSSDTVEYLAVEIGKKLFSLVLAGDTEVNIAMRTADIGLDSLVAIELKAWWKLNFGFDISTIEMMSMGTLEALGKRAVEGLASMHQP